MSPDLLSASGCQRVLQQPGDVVFVPSGWHHQVENEEDAVSVNHNWLNGANVAHVWRQLDRAREDVKRELQDCRWG